jgi:hypothetical protein
MSSEQFHTPESSPESFPRIGDMMVGNMLQLSLMPLAYERRHQTELSDMTQAELRKKAVGEWMLADAEIFRAYVEAHADETIDLGDSDALRNFLDRMWESQTLQ